MIRKVINKKLAFSINKSPMQFLDALKSAFSMRKNW